MFLRVTNAVSRQQEFSADQLAARTISTQATISGLQKVHKYGQAFSAFFQQEYLPVVEAGYRPPLLNGFEMFLKAPRVVEAVNHYYQEQLTQGRSDPYDTHPSLKERISALENVPGGRILNDQSASTLLTNSENLEYILLRELMVDKQKADGLQNILWDDVAETAFAPRWEKNASTYQSLLCKLTPLTLFDEVQNAAILFSRIAAAGKFLPGNVTPAQVPHDQQHQIINSVIGAALASALRKNGWKIKTNPGEDLVFVKGSKELRPFNFWGHLLTDKPSREQWQTFCEENQISNMSLA
jgi:hypothetical protein